MAILEMEVEKLKADGENLKKLSKKYSSLLNDMYDKIDNLVKSGGWESKIERGSANVFLAKVLKDKENMLSLSSSISFLGELIINYADKVGKIVDDKVE